MPQQDFRARLKPKNLSKALYILGPNNPSNILFPLYSTRGVLFPYTPEVTTGSEVAYDQTPFIHSNYGYSAYIRSFPKPISISAKFTAQTNDEAIYLLAVLHFFRSVTKSYFGVTPYERAGTPPPVLLFQYLGEYQFNDVPVLIKSFDYTYSKDVDYVPVNTSNSSLYSGGKAVSLPLTSSGGYSYVPVELDVTLELETQYIPSMVRNEFNLDDFRQGKLFNKGFI